MNREFRSRLDIGFYSGGWLFNMLVVVGVVLLGLYDKKGVKFYDMVFGFFGIFVYVWGEEVWWNL